MSRLYCSPECPRCFGFRTNQRLRVSSSCPADVAWYDQKKARFSPMIYTLKLVLFKKLCSSLSVVSRSVVRPPSSSLISPQRFLAWSLPVAFQDKSLGIVMLCRAVDCCRPAVLVSVTLSLSCLGATTYNVSFMSLWCLHSLVSVTFAFTMLWLLRIKRRS